MPGGGLGSGLSSGLVNSLSNIPIWYPPMSLKWILTVLVLFVGSVANRLKPSVRAIFTSPIGFFGSSLAAFAMFKYGFAPLAFAMIFFLLNVWAAEESEAFSNQVAAQSSKYEGQEAYPQFFEGFLGGMDNLEWVTNNKRWFVERVLKERPEAILEKGVLTLPISGFSAQGSTTAGST